MIRSTPEITHQSAFWSFFRGGRNQGAQLQSEAAQTPVALSSLGSEDEDNSKVAKSLGKGCTGHRLSGGEGRELRRRQAHSELLSLITLGVVLCQLVNFFESQLLDLQNGSIKPYLKGLLEGFHEVMNYSA